MDRHIEDKAQKDGRGYFYSRLQSGEYAKVPTWIDDGEWVRSHPTDDKRGPIAAPPNVRIRAYTAEEDKDQAAREAYQHG